jgi:hypothetical protein
MKNRAAGFLAPTFRNLCQDPFSVCSEPGWLIIRQRVRQRLH